jgi:carbohydrate-selective porin OprB
MIRAPARFIKIPRLVLAWIVICHFTVSTPAVGQQTSPVNGGPTQPKFGCQHVADPRRRQHSCNDDLFNLDESLAGDWNKVRRAAMRIGITPTASYVSALQTNVTGGQHQVWSYAGLLTVAAGIDLRELIGIPGLSVYVGTSWGTGSNLAGSLDSAIPTSGLYAPSFYLGEMYLQQKFQQGKMILLAGRLSAANSFAALPIFANYVNYGINPNPYSLGANDVTFFSPPTGAEWGAQATYTVTPAIQVSAGAFNTNIHSANGENHGADFTLQEGNKGVLAAGEIDYLHNQKQTSAGKPGQLSFGVLHNNNSFPNLINPTDQSEGYSGIYLMGQQMVFRPDGPGTSRGATAWGAWAHNSKDIISPIPWFWGAGLSYEGIRFLPRKDIVSVGLIRADSSKYAAPENKEQLLEFNYQWVHSRYLTITPHAQYLWKQPGHEGRNATVLGIQLGVTL